MFKAMYYVLKENITNFYRIFSISKYEVLADVRDTKLGMFWNFANPTIQVLTYWFAFGVVFNRKAVESQGMTIPYIFWQMGGFVVWYFISPCITSGCSAIYSKINVVSHMKFPVSILPATVVGKELFEHGCIMVVLTVIYCIFGYPPSIYWLQLIYYCFCGVCLAVSITMCTSVLTMVYRDTRKLVSACMRMLLYTTPILWNIDRVKNCPAIFLKIVKANPIYYVASGYRDSFFYHKGILHYPKANIRFWIIVLFLYAVGSNLMYHFQRKFVDLY